MNSSIIEVIIVVWKYGSNNDRTDETEIDSRSSMQRSKSDEQTFPTVHTGNYGQLVPKNTFGWNPGQKKVPITSLFVFLLLPARNQTANVTFFILSFLIALYESRPYSKMRLIFSIMPHIETCHFRLTG